MKTGTPLCWLALAVAWNGAASIFAAEGVDYLREIKPLLKERCFACHGALQQKAGLRLDTLVQMRQGGESGPAIVPGNAAASELVRRVISADPNLRMPPEGMPLAADQIALIQRWIAAGATVAENERPEDDPREHWAFRTPIRPKVPALAGSSGEVRNPVDAFVLEKLAAAGITPRPEADKSVLLRRVYLDLIGIPPTREELHAFLADESPMAYEAIVDRLLADPRHGERWARHWMDLWRYSDWYGRRHVPDVWNSAPQIWRWRDWIVRSLNEDHGYDRMVREMLAADEVCPEDDEAAVATGYLIRNWYALNPNDWMRNIVEHTGKAFLGLTVNCAHCHDHKYDPITQDDYFRLRAFFEPIYIRQDRVVGEADPGPFQDYDYGKLRVIQRLGMVRVFDKSPEAPTWHYSGGDERNRDKNRGSALPGVPAFLGGGEIPAPSPIALPVRAFYPGLRPAIIESLLRDARAAITSAETQLAAVPPPNPSPAASERLAQAEATFLGAVREAQEKSQPGALAGSQSLLFEATAGRRVLQNGLTQLESLEDKSVLSFQLLLLNDVHFNFQLAKDVVKGLTAGYVAFDQGRIMSYQPGGFTEFEVGRYDFAGTQRRFLVELTIETTLDRCLLTVRSTSDGKTLCDSIPVALNGWNPVGDATKGISFDARTGSVAVIDDLTLTSPAREGQTPATLIKYDFEPPEYVADQDVAGIGGWLASSFGVAPATSLVSTTAGSASLRELWNQLLVARRAVEATTLPRREAEARLAAAQAELASLEARIAADRAKFGETPGVDAAALARDANRLERIAGQRKSEADLLASEHALALAEAKPTTEMNRAKEVEAATKSLATAKSGLAQARKVAGDPPTESYAPLGPTYPKASTGRRKLLAEWMTSSKNPLTARVAVNHIWSHHFHQPLVATVTDFGRNGAKPSHPELLDWLACEFMESGWSMTHLHRLMVTSAAYRRVSRSTEPGSATMASPPPSDPENRLLWRMNPGRMESEVVRDSVLYVAGKLDLKQGGQELENPEALKTFRRSLYYSVFPEQGGKHALGELFDAPDALECYRRTKSIVPQQALALTNSDFVHQMSTELAKVAGTLRVPSATPSSTPSSTPSATSSAPATVVALFEQVLSRPPTESERAACLGFLGTAPDPALWASLARVLLNHNDFVTIR